MARNVADILWEMLANAGVKRCYGICRRRSESRLSTRSGATAKVNSSTFATKRYYGFAAVADAYLTGDPKSPPAEPPAPASCISSTA